jgi:hypothetical protein
VWERSRNRFSTRRPAIPYVNFVGFSSGDMATVINDGTFLLTINIPTDHILNIIFLLTIGIMEKVRTVMLYLAI